MTTPTLPPQQQAQQSPPPPPDGLDDLALAIAVAALLATAVSAPAAVAALRPRFRLSNDTWAALGAVLGDVMQHPPPVTGVIGSASEQTARMNAARRAQFVLAASRRVLGAIRQARSKGQPVTGAILGQLDRERRYFAQHRQAMWDRARAAGQIDIEAATHGGLLGWYARHDGKATAECRAADRHNFYVSSPPSMGLPGIGPHTGCRCEAGPAWPGGKLLPGSRAPRYAWAA